MSNEHDKRKGIIMPPNIGQALGEATAKEQRALDLHMAISTAVYAELIAAYGTGSGETMVDKLQDLSNRASEAATIHLRKYGYNVVFKSNG